MKAEVLNGFAREHAIVSIFELGCGDGNQLSLAEYPQYVGIDIAPAAIAKCKALYESDLTKRFFVLGEESIPPSELGLSLDVIYHLVEDEEYESHLGDLFDNAIRYVALYTSDSEEMELTNPPPSHIRHRPVASDVESRFPSWTLLRRIPNRYAYKPGDPETSFANFSIYRRGTA
jgi:SAM-dependent methyltransferase